MKKEVESSKAKVEEMQQELSAWKFTPDRFDLFFESGLLKCSNFIFSFTVKQESA